MSQEIHIRPEPRGGFGIYRGENLLVFNLTDLDVIEFCSQLKYFVGKIIDEPNAYFGTNQSVAKLFLSARKTRGRRLILESHISLLRDMMAKDPSTTTRDIEIALRRLGVKFSAVSAIQNVARRYNLKLAA